MARFTRERKIDKGANGGLELDGLTLASERTSAKQSGKGWRHLRVDVNVTARTNLTALICKLETSPDGSTFGQKKSESIASGTGTLSSYSQSFATTSTGITSFYFDLDDDFWRIKVSATAGAAGDTFEATARLSD